MQRVRVRRKAPAGSAGQRVDGSAAAQSPLAGVRSTAAEPSGSTESRNPALPLPAVPPNTNEDDHKASAKR